MTIYLESIGTQLRVIMALVLRDMRSRFSHTFFGYVILVLWPLSHLLMLLLTYLFTRSLVPIGTSAAVFFATGLLPYILCLYPSRQIAMALVQNQPLLYFPIVKSLDVIIARGVLEIVTAFWVVFLFCILLFIFDVDIMPAQPEEALLAIAATIFFSFSVGVLSAVLFKLVRAWMIILILILIGIYFSSGALFVPSALSETLQYYISFNPLFHCVEWLRSAYYDGYNYGLLNKQYLMGFSAVLLCLGLAIERLARGYLLEPN
jgi:capsular polysaccharide transport system permease protein